MYFKKSYFLKIRFFSYIVLSDIYIRAQSKNGQTGIFIKNQQLLKLIYSCLEYSSDRLEYAHRYNTPLNFKW